MKSPWREHEKTEYGERGNPAYVRLYRKLADEIDSGVYRPGDKLPSEASIYLSTGLSKGTIRKALDLLEEARYINRVRGSGTYVRRHCEAEEKIEEFFELCRRMGMENREALELLEEACRRRFGGSVKRPVAAVFDCTPEIADDMIEQLWGEWEIGGVYYPIEEILEGRIKTAGDEDIWITTKAHYGELLPLAERMGRPLFMARIGIVPELLAQLRGLDRETVIGIIYDNEKFVRHIGCILASVGCFNSIFPCRRQEWEKRRVSKMREAFWICTVKDPEFSGRLDQEGARYIRAAYRIEEESMHDALEYLRTMRGTAVELQGRGKDGKRNQRG